MKIIIFTIVVLSLYSFTFKLNEKNSFRVLIMTDLHFESNSTTK